MSWNIQESNTSFSSFESDSSPKHHRRTDTAYFSEFQDDFQQTKLTHHQSPSFGGQFINLENQKKQQQQKQKEVEAISMKVQSLEEQNKILKKQNELLKRQNLMVKEKMSNLKEKNENLISKLSVHENEESEHKDKYIELVGEVKRLKDSLKQMRKEIQKKDKSSEILKTEIKEIRIRNQEEEWRVNFTNLFLDMMMKISKQIEPEWNEKKKLQISWKMAKNIIKKAIQSGVQLPKVVKNPGDTTYLSQFSRNV